MGNEQYREFYWPTLKVLENDLPPQGRSPMSTQKENMIPGLNFYLPFSILEYVCRFWTSGPKILLSSLKKCNSQSRTSALD